MFALQLLVIALTLASIYALIAVGVTVVFGLTGLVNFAHADIMTIGAYVGVLIAASSGPLFLLSLLAAAAVTAVVGAALERGLFRWTLNRPINGFIISLGLIAIIENLLSWRFGVFARTASPPITTVWHAGRITIPAQYVVVFACSVAILACYEAFIHRTPWGRAIRAASENQTVAQLMGVRTRSLNTTVFAIGSAMAGLAGVFLETVTSVSPTVGSLFIVKAFAVAMVGGLGSSRGILVGAVGLALAESYIPGNLVPEQWSPVVSFVLIAVVLLAWPRGIFRGLSGSATT